MYVFRGQLYDIDDSGEYARFMSPSGLWLQLCIGIARYKDSSGDVNYRALGAFMDSATDRGDYQNNAAGSGRPILSGRYQASKPPTAATDYNFAEQTKILNGSTELARTVYVSDGPDSIEIHWVGIKLG